MRIFILAFLGLILATSAPAGQGYEGLIAPSSKPGEEKQKPPGYSGLIPGAVRNFFKKEEPASTAPPAQTPATRTPKVDLKAAAAASGIVTNLQKPTPLPEKTAVALNKPRARMNGMLPAEYAANSMIADYMKRLSDKNLKGDARKALAAEAAQKLQELADGFRYKSAVPDRVYSQMGLSDTYIAEEREGSAKAVSQLDAALAALKDYQ